jgi:hypothetical protein
MPLLNVLPQTKNTVELRNGIKQVFSNFSLLIAVGGEGDRRYFNKSEGWSSKHFDSRQGRRSRDRRKNDL